MQATAPHPATESVRLNAVPILNVSMTEALSILEATANAREKRCVFFVNADCMNISAGNSEYHRALTRDDAIVFGDGAGIRLAGRISRQPVRDNVNGTDMFPLLCAQCAANGQSIFLLGARPGVAEEVERRMTSRFPSLRITGSHHGYFGHDNSEEIVRQVNESGADILLVAFGAPLQEFWIARNREHLAPPVAMGVGGLFDVYSGRLPRAPRPLRNASLEWLWLLVMQPRHRWRRYLIGNFTFVGRVIHWEWSRKNAAR